MRMSITRKQALELRNFCLRNKVDEFFLSNDNGAYIGATSGKDDTFKNSIHYIKGCNPDNDPDYYEECRYKYGGDDFGVHLPVDWLNEFFNNQHYKDKRMFAIQLNQKSVRLVA